MATMTTAPDSGPPAPTSGGRWAGRGGSGGPPWSGPRRRRSVPHLLLGVLLVAVCAAASLWVLTGSDGRRPVLALARAVTVGQVLGPQDLLPVDVAVDAGVGVVSAERAAQLVGQRMATSLPAGALLPPDAVGVGAVPVAGQGIASLALGSGQLPAEVTPGARVAVVFAPPQPTPGAGTPSRVWPAVVTSVASAQREQVTVVSVALAEDDAREVAAVPAGQLALVMLAAGDR